LNDFSAGIVSGDHGDLNLEWSSFAILGFPERDRKKIFP
jgi:hypothetical protein